MIDLNKIRLSLIRSAGFIDFIAVYISECIHATGVGTKGRVVVRRAHRPARLSPGSLDFHFELALPTRRHVFTSLPIFHAFVLVAVEGEELV